MLVLKEAKHIVIPQRDTRFSQHFTIYKEAIVAIVVADTAHLLRISPEK